MLNLLLDTTVAPLEQYVVWPLKFEPDARPKVFQKGLYEKVSPGIRKE